MINGGLIRGVNGRAYVYTFASTGCRHPSPWGRGILTLRGGDKKNTEV